MIKINLLPFRAARKKENIRRQVSIYVLLLVFSASSLLYWSISLGGKLKIVQTKVDDITEEVSVFSEKAKQVDKIKKKLALLKQKRSVIETLERNRKEPVRLLEAMTEAVVKERMWFTEMEEKVNSAPAPPPVAPQKKGKPAQEAKVHIPPTTSSVNIKGVAFDNQTVADFMTNLESMPMFESVRLVNIEQQTIREIKMKKFEIVCSRISSTQSNETERTP